MTVQTSTTHDFNSAEVIPGDEYQPRHRDTSVIGTMNGLSRDRLAKIPETPIAQYVGKHREPERCPVHRMANCPCPAMRDAS